MSAPFLFEPGAPSAPEATGGSPPPDEPTPEPANPGLSDVRSLYRKYRPQTFDDDDLVGQEPIVRTLRNAIRLERVAHAYLFCGPRGTGKTTTARLLAKAVNCLDPDPDRRPCNVCANCRAIASGAATDVVEIDAASNRGIDDIRDLRERVKYAPTQLRVKFYIVDEAHQITGPAANAFLKTLEEPPTHTKFVLATTDPEELLPTIVSRCQRFDFRRIGLDAMTTRLRTVAAAEELAVTDDALTTIARHATGSLRDALGLLDQLALFREQPAEEVGTDAITAEDVRTVLGVSRNDRVETLVAALADRDAVLALGSVNAAVEAGEDPRQLNRQLVSYLRLLLHQRAGGSPDADERAQALASRFDLSELAGLARLFGEIDYRIKHSAYAQLPLEVALVDGVHRGSREASIAGQTVAPSAVQPEQASSAGPPPQIPPPHPERGDDRTALSRPPTTALRDRVRGVERVRSAPGAVAALPPQPPSSASPPVAPVGSDSSISNTNGTGGPVDVERLVDLWPRVRQDVKAINRRIEALLSSVDPASVDGGRVTLAAAYEFHRDKLNTDEVRVVVEEAIGRLLGQPIRVWCVLRGEAGLVTSSITPATPADGSEPVQTLTPPGPPPTPPATAPDEDAPSLIGESTASDEEVDAEERRIRAAKNIFDAEEIEQPGIAS